MTESLAEKQVRLDLEATCAQLFSDAYTMVDCDMTLLLFSYHGGAFSNVAFKTTLSMSDLVETFEALCQRWRGRAPNKTEAQRLPNEAEVRELLASLSASVMRSVGVAFVCGRGESIIYCSTAHREDMLKLIEEELLPHWRKQP